MGYTLERVSDRAATAPTAAAAAVPKLKVCMRVTPPCHRCRTARTSSKKVSRNEISMKLLEWFQVGRKQNSAGDIQVQEPLH
jgi:hypothetical protein